MNAGLPTEMATRPSAAKHVNYTLGMVLGVDDFVQEFAYLNGRDQAAARDIVGYGTLSGLQVSVSSDARGPRIAVSPGVALTPRGQTVRVCAAQCAYVADWLNDHRAEIAARLSSPPPDVLRAYITLCYRDCPADLVPIPGEPCRAEDDMMAPSRLIDDFTLELRFDPPDHAEEEALQAFVHWLTQVPVGGASPGSTLEELLAALRDAALSAASPPGPALFAPATPPPSLRIAAADACDYLKAAFRVWVTELRT